MRGYVFNQLRISGLEIPAFNSSDFFNDTIFQLSNGGVKNLFKTGKPFSGNSNDYQALKGCLLNRLLSLVHNLYLCTTILKAI